MNINNILLIKENQIKELQTRLSEAEANLEAILSGNADAIVVRTENGVKVFTIQGAETAYRIMVETMNEGAITIDIDGVVLYANTRFCTMLGMPCSVLVGSKIQTMVPQPQKNAFELFLKKTAYGCGSHQDFEFIRQDQSKIPVYLSSAPLEIPDRHDMCIIATDLTERNIAKQKLLDLNNSLELKIKESTRELQKLAASLEQQVDYRTSQVRELAKQLSLAEQKQRQRLSVILHEDVQQTLFAIRTRFNLLKDIIKSGSPEELDEDLAELDKLIFRALDTTKQLAIEFNPPVLSNEGLDASLKWLMHHINKRYGLKIELFVSAEISLIREEERVLIVSLTRELLFNILKHAETSTAVVAVSRDTNHIYIQVEDKGVGFNVEQEKNIKGERTHMGLFSIEERLHLFGGSLSIHSLPGEGTKILMTIPFDIDKKQLGVG